MTSQEAVPMIDIVVVVLVALIALTTLGALVGIHFTIGNEVDGERVERK